jgi:regulator of protease activity HflC (stomatin/prohibitin superfamily)
MTSLLFLLFIAIALAIIAAKSIVIVKETERLVVFRLGQLLRVDDPGQRILIPFVDIGVKVSIESIPKWRRLLKKELDEKAVEMASQDKR